MACSRNVICSKGSKDSTKSSREKEKMVFTPVKSDRLSLARSTVLRGIVCQYQIFSLSGGQTVYAWYKNAGGL